MRFVHRILGSIGFAALVAGCSSHPNGPDGGITAATHTWFPIAAGVHMVGGPSQDGTIGCDSCHSPDADSFKSFTCISCHDHAQAITDELHQAVAMYRYTDEGCYSCHADGARVSFDHAGIVDQCASCHDVNRQFAALPLQGNPGFMHPDMLSSDCGACHITTTWLDAGTTVNKSDPNHDYPVDEQIPSYAGTTLVTLTPQSDSLPQVMNHNTTTLPSSTLTVCVNCHVDAPSIYYPGDLHSSLANLTLPEPTACLDCHRQSQPAGFVGPVATNPARTPSGPEMKHDAVAWNNGNPTTTKLVTQDCSVCHQSPQPIHATAWNLDLNGNSPVTFHPSLSAAQLAQPGSCLDCHANTRPVTNVTSGLITFDHSLPVALGECQSCHTASAPAFTSWAGGKFHAAGAAAPSTCLPCHDSERPANTNGWTANYAASPFDYGDGGMALHGDGQDCAICHSGSTSSWATGHFDHDATLMQQVGCLVCHTSQRPDRVLGAAQALSAIGFDHTVDGTGDCFGCHQATVGANSYVNYFKAGTNTLPGGDWQGGQKYPGSVLVGAPNQFITVTELTLQRSGGLITGMTSVQATLNNAMLHTSAAIPSQVAPGPNGDMNSCHYCHTVTNGTITYANGQFHSALMTAGIQQPSSGCVDCHVNMRPSHIVQLAGASIQSMDHAAVLDTGNANALDCSTCHAGAVGNSWANGKFHASIGSSKPTDCSFCHYPLMADTTKADMANGTSYGMKHRSAQMKVQTCDTCHLTAFAQATLTPVTSTHWATGAFHVSLTAQPTACNDCHLVSEPASAHSTQSAVTYSMPKGGTSSNGAQWMNHGSSFVSGKDCVVCHAADAKATGSAWLKTDQFHPAVANPTTCTACHGTGNGGGSVQGTNNNLPAAITDSSTVTTASTPSSTGIAVGTLDQILHSDSNVTAHECNFCHTQVGTSGQSGIQGKEWAQASFHKNFNTTYPLVTNGTTGRCSNCHMNVRPGTAFTPQDHSTFTAASGSTDCSSCHSWPGGGGAGKPDWTGASGGAPATISVGGFTVANPPAGNGSTTEGGISALPHPSVGSQMCAACHTGGVGAKNAIGYDHAATSQIDQHCNACHEAGSNLIGTPWNGATTLSGGAGDTRPFNVTPMKATKGSGSSCNLSNTSQHFYPVDCFQCHPVPTGTVTVSTGSTYTSRWTFPHKTGNMTNSTCNLCHGNGNPCGT